MNTTTDLRETLARHAELHDRDVAGRVASVRGRVRVVRRRRRAAVAGAAAAIVVAGFGLAELQSSEEDAAPVSHRVGKVDAPHTIRSLGYTYTFVEGVAAVAEPGRTAARGTIPAGDTPHLVSWGTAGDTDESVFVRVERAPTHNWYGPDFTDFVFVPAGREVDFEVFGADAAAVYELSESAPGVSAHGVTFREQVGSFGLAGAEFGETGQSEVALPVEPSGGQSSYGRFCQSSVPGAQFQLVHDDAVVLAGRCAGPEFDPGVISNTTSLPASAEGVLTMRLLPKGADLMANDPNATLEDPEARLGVALYEAVGRPFEKVLGWEVEPIVEYEGHTWQYLRTIPGDDQDVVRIPSGDVPYLLTIASQFTENTEMVIRTDGSIQSRTMAPDSMTTGLMQWPERGDIVVRPKSAGPLHGEFAVVLYELAD